MRKGFFALIVTLIFGFSAHANLENYAGAYSGKFEGRKGTLHISVNAGALVASYVGANGTTDILGGGCYSKIGQMIDIDYDNNGKEVDHVTFAFDPGTCSTQVWGRELNVDFKHKNKKVNGAKASVYVNSTYDDSWTCVPQPYPPGGPVCYPQSKRVDWFATGSFKK